MSSFNENQMHKGKVCIWITNIICICRKHRFLMVGLQSRKKFGFAFGMFQTLPACKADQKGARMELGVQAGVQTKGHGS